jgi:glucose/mannose-6-phosphate isomerase
MRKIILEFPKQFRIGIKATKNLKIKKGFRKVCVCGMGGSALPANLLLMLIEEKKLNFPLTIQRDYTLPSFAKKDTLIICISYSGNTEETISCLKEAFSKKLNIVLISSDGLLEKFARRYNLPIALIPKGYPPRMALGYQYSALVGVLNKAGLVKNSITKEILKLENQLKPKELENEGESLAKKIKGKIPIIYASNRLKYLARIWKIKFNENSKIPSFWNYFPELNHNEMTGFENVNCKLQIADLFYLIVLQDRDDHPRNKKRMKLTQGILKKRGIKGEIIKLKGKTFLERLFNGILLSDWTSYYLAKIYNIDPIPVKMVEEFKKEMAQ